MIVLHLPSWFPHEEKPLDGNFILRQIATVAPHTTSIVVHHVGQPFDRECAAMMDENIIFRPIFTQKGTSKIQMLRAYDYEVEKIIRKYGKPDLIHLHVALPLAPVALWLSYRYHIPLVISEHWSIYQPQNRPQLSWGQRLQLRQVFHRAAMLTTVSENLHQAICDTVRSARKVTYTGISNVVDTEVFTLGNPTRIGNKKQILHVSTLDNNAKNILGILRVVKRLSRIRNDFELNIIHDLQNAEVEQYIHNENLGDYIHLLGKKTEQEVAYHIQQSDFMLQFSNYENQPCVLLESFCCGKPILATTVGGIPEIANNNNALLVGPQDEDGLLEKMTVMLDTCRQYDALQIRQDAVARYAQDVIGKKIMACYHEVTRHR